MRLKVCVQKVYGKSKTAKRILTCDIHVRTKLTYFLYVTAVSLRRIHTRRHFTNVKKTSRELRLRTVKLFDGHDFGLRIIISTFPSLRFLHYCIF